MRDDTKTKVIATIGPASNDKKVIDEMIKHHMDIARLNFSWGNNEWHIEIIKKINS